MCLISPWLKRGALRHYSVTLKGHTKTRIVSVREDGQHEIDLLQQLARTGQIITSDEDRTILVFLNEEQMSKAKVTAPTGRTLYAVVSYESKDKDQFETEPTISFRDPDF